MNGPKVFASKLIAGLLASLSLVSLSVAQSKGTEIIEVLVPIGQIDAGTPLEPTLFRKEGRPAAVVGATVVSNYDDLKGNFAAAFIPGGQPLLKEYITAKRPVNQIQANIPDGFRAVTIGVDITTGVEGWARPGAKVDVVLTAVISGRPAVSVIVQNSKVLSAGRGAGSNEASGEAGPPSTVTLLVTAEEAARIQLAATSGRLSLALRGDEDTIESPDNTTITLDGLSGVDNGAAAQIPNEGRVKIDGKVYTIVHGKLVPGDSKLVGK